MAKRKTQVLDTQVAKKIIEFETTLFLYIDKAMPKKFANTLVRQMTDSSAGMRRAALRALGMDMQLEPLDKLKAFEEAQMYLRDTSVVMSHLNNLGAVSNHAKAILDELMYGISDNLYRLATTTRSKVTKSLSQNGSAVQTGTPTGET